MKGHDLHSWRSQSITSLHILLQTWKQTRLPHTSVANANARLGLKCSSTHLWLYMFFTMVVCSNTACRGFLVSHNFKIIICFKRQFDFSHGEITHAHTKWKTERIEYGKISIQFSFLLTLRVWRKVGEEADRLGEKEIQCWCWRCLFCYLQKRNREIKK